MLVEATEAMVSDVDKETITKLVEVAKAECAEHDILRRDWNVRLAQEADQRWCQRYLRLRKLSCSHGETEVCNISRTDPKVRAAFQTPDPRRPVTAATTPAGTRRGH